MKNLVFITDCVDSENINSMRKDLEGNTSEQNSRLLKSLNPLFEKIYHYTSIDEFKNHIDQHKNDLIFPVLYGENSCTQKTILPALCEAYNLDYIGADAYTHTICNDKSLSKLYAKQFGIHSANSFYIDSLSKLDSTPIKLLKLPLIIKPNYGGGSVGITNKNVVYNYTDAKKMAIFLLQKQKVPIIIEEYISGYEVELILLGSKEKIIFCEEVKLLLNDKEKFDSEIWGLETKKIDDSKVDFSLSNLILEKDRLNLISLFQSFNKIEFARIDGRIHNGDFYLLEISPDCYLGDDCAFYYAFQQKKLSHTELFDMIIKNHQDLL